MELNGNQPFEAGYLFLKLNIGVGAPKDLKSQVVVSSVHGRLLLVLFCQVRWHSTPWPLTQSGWNKCFVGGWVGFHRDGGKNISNLYWNTSRELTNFSRNSIVAFSFGTGFLKFWPCQAFHTVDGWSCTTWDVSNPIKSWDKLPTSTGDRPKTSGASRCHKRSWVQVPQGFE